MRTPEEIADDDNYWGRWEPKGICTDYLHTGNCQKCNPGHFEKKNDRVQDNSKIGHQGAKLD